MTALARTLRGQMPVLDALRGLAIVVVLAHRFDMTPDPPSWPSRIVCMLMEGGWWGVQLFFVLSGFLITGILLESKGSPSYFRAFFARRVLRIFPLYYAVLFVAFAIVPMVTGAPIDGHEHQAWLWTYLSNWAAPLGLGVPAFSHFWSLAVEEQFYLAWPIVVKVVSGKALPILCGVMIVAAFGSRVLLRAYGASPDVVYEITPCRFDALAMGAAAAWALRVPALAQAIASRLRAIVVTTALLFVVGAVITDMYPRTSLETQTAGYSVIAFVSVVMLIAAVLVQSRGDRLAKLLAPAPLRALGKYSYAMYIFHAPIHHMIGVPLLARLHQPNPTLGVTLIYFVAMTGITFAAAVASYHVLEKRFLRLKDRFPVARAAA